MICRRERRCKQPVRFAEPPWDRHSPQWIALDEELAEDHVAREIVAAVADLDLTQVRESYSASGSPPHPPDLMLAMILIELRRGRRSPSQWDRDTRYDKVAQWAGFGLRPARSCWYEFCDRMAPFVDELNRQVLHKARRLGITTAERATLDGSAVAANASRHRVLNESRLRKRMQALHEAIRAGEEGLPVGALPAWMAKSPATRMLQQARYGRAGDHLKTLLEANEQRCPSERQARKKVVVSPGDPDAALGRDKFNVFRPLCNVQIVHDLDSPLMLGYEAFAQPTDAVTLEPMIRKTKALTGAKVSKMVHEELIEAHRAFMETAESKKLTKLRGQIAERIYADLKEHRELRRFRRRGLVRCRTELGLNVLAHNLKEVASLPRPEQHSVAQAPQPP